MRTFAFQGSLHGVYATGRAQRYYIRFTIPNKHKRSTGRLPRRFVEEFSQLREQKMEKAERKRKKDRDLYVVEVVKVDTTRKQPKIHFVGSSHEYDEWRDYDNKRNYFLNCVPKITYLCSKLCNNETHTSKYTIMNLLYRRNRSAVV